MKIILIMIALVLLTPIMAYASPSDETIEKRTNEIYSICKEHNLIIKEGAIINKKTNQSLILVPWEWGKNDLLEIIKIFGTGEPYRNYTNYKNDCDQNGNTYYIQSGDMIDGCHILQCGDHFLDISDTKYFLDGEEIAPSQDISNVSINNQGNLAQGGSLQNVKQNININVEKENFWLTWIYPGLSSIFLALLSHVIIYPHSKSNARLKNIMVSIITMAFISYLIVVIIKFLV